MRKKYLVIIFSFVFVIVLFCGCFEENNSSNDNDDEENFIVFSAQQYYKDKTIEIKEDGTVVIDFQLLQNNDKIVIKDIINDIGYIESQGNTFIKFQFQDLLEGDNNQQIDVIFIFKDNITNVFEVGDEVEISVTIEHVEFTFNNTEYDIEVFEEEWDQEYFEVNGDFKPLTLDCIKKV